MSRHYQIGDLVRCDLLNGVSYGRITSEEFVHDCFFGFWINDDFLVEPEEICHCGGYKDQFTPWKPGCLVMIGAETITKPSGLEISARVIANGAIKRMIKEQ